MNWKTPSRLMAGTITMILLGLFGFVLIVPAFRSGTEFDPALVQTLLTLTVVAVTYYIGTSNGSAAKDETIKIQAASAAPLGVLNDGEPAVVKIDDSEPVKVKEQAAV